LHLDRGQRVAPKTKTVPADIIILLSIKTITNVSADIFAINLLVVNEGSDKGRVSESVIIFFESRQLFSFRSFFFVFAFAFAFAFALFHT
jgi:hypothetical protein